MTERRLRAAGLIILAASFAPAVPALPAQASATLGLGASYIEYDGFLSSGAAFLAPAVRFSSPSFTFGAQGRWTRFESGTRVLQGNVAGGWLGGGAGPWRLEVSGSAGASSYADREADGHLLGGVRVHLAGGRSGAWVGAAAGQTFGARDETPRELSLAGWHVERAVALVGSATATWFGDVRYLELLGALRWTANPLELELRLGARPWSRSRRVAGDPIVGGFADGSLRLSLTDRLALSLGGGTYPSDPVRRVLGARYLNLGMQIRAFGRGTPERASLESLRRPTPVDRAAGPAFLVVPDGRETHLQVRVAGANSVEVMGDFSDWQPVALRRVAPGLWEATWPVAAGAHRVNVRIDGGPWLAPEGLRTESGEFGGPVGVVIVP